MKNCNELQVLFKNKNKISMIIDYEEVLSSYTKSFSAENFNPMIKRVLGNYGKKDYMTISILMEEDSKKYFKKLKISAPNLNFHFFKDFSLEEINGANKDFLPIYLGNNPDIISLVKASNGLAIGVDCFDKNLDDLIDFKITKNKFEEFLINTNNLYL